MNTDDRRDPYLRFILASGILVLKRLVLTRFRRLFSQRYPHSQPFIPIQKL